MAPRWRPGGALAGLAENRRRAAGTPLQPLTLRGVLTVGASHPQWRQALQYNRLQLLAAMKAAGTPSAISASNSITAAFRKPLRAKPDLGQAPEPLRCPRHGAVPRCGRPAPNGEINLWEVCGFCHRQRFSA